MVILAWQEESELGPSSEFMSRVTLGKGPDFPELSFLIWKTEIVPLAIITQLLRAVARG